MDGYAIGVTDARIVFPSIDRKSTRLNPSHSQISHAVFCLKKKPRNLPDDPAALAPILHPIPLVDALRRDTPPCVLELPGARRRELSHAASRPCHWCFLHSS